MYFIYFQEQCLNFIFICQARLKVPGTFQLKRSMKKLLFLILYNLLVICIIFLLLETLTRIFFPQIKSQGTDENIFSENVYYDSHGLKPFSSGLSNGAQVKINKYGFRDYSTKFDSTKNSWLILGDSVTMGIGIEADSTFAGRIQAKNDSINILNPAIVGYAIQDYENLANHFFMKGKNEFRITKVLLFWCLNDIYIDVPDFETPGGSLRNLMGDLLKIIRTKSRAYMLVKTLLFDRPKSYYLFDEKFYASTTLEFQNAIQKLDKINRLSVEQRIDFTIILLPYEYQLRNKDSNKTKPQELMSMELPKNLICLDPVQFLISQEESFKDMFLFGDGIHLSNFGHRLIADYLEKPL